MFRKPLLCLITTIQGGYTGYVTFEKVISSLNYHYLNIQNFFALFEFALTPVNHIIMAIIHLIFGIYFQYTKLFLKYPFGMISVI